MFCFGHINSKAKWKTSCYIRYIHSVLFSFLLRTLSTLFLSTSSKLKKDQTNKIHFLFLRLFEPLSAFLSYSVFLQIVFVLKQRMLVNESVQFLKFGRSPNKDFSAESFSLATKNSFFFTSFFVLLTCWSKFVFKHRFWIFQHQRKRKKKKTRNCWSFEQLP